jgi:predicted amidohydrolase
MKAGFIQFAPQFGNVDANINKALSMVDTADAGLLVLPELFNTGYHFTSVAETRELAEEIPAGKTTKALCTIAQKKNIYIIAGIAEIADGSLYNSAVLISPAGYVATYRKVHLYNEEKLWFQPGNKGFDVYDIGQCKIGIMICFDWFFPESARILAIQGADVICHPANLVLPYCQDAMVTRCLENKIYAITANRTGYEDRSGKRFSYTGKSQITSPDGSILYRAAQDSDEIGIVEIDISTARDKRTNIYNDLFADRRVEYYQDLVNTKLLSNIKI